MIFLRCLIAVLCPTFASALQVQSSQARKEIQPDAARRCTSFAWTESALDWLRQEGLYVYLGSPQVGTNVTDTQRQKLDASKQNGLKNVLSEYYFDCKTLWAEVQHSRDRCPSMNAYIFSSVDNFERRAAIREMWQRAYLRYPSPLKYSFALCTQAGVSDELHREQDTYGDVTFLDCQEGYLGGGLTRKVAAAMNHFLQTEMAYSLFLKIDDDTFISFDRLCGYMSHEVNHEGVDLDKAYMGVFVEGDEYWRGREVIRDPISPWYEPWEKYTEEKYPLAAKGGPGYILSRHMIQELCARDIPVQYELNNEDKAVGYWVSLLKDVNPIRFVNIPGTDGYDEHKSSIIRTGSFQDYPNVVHHHLDGYAIQCMHKVEFANPTESQTIDHCLSPAMQSLWTVRHKDHVRIHMP